ncbi:MAG: cytochrome P450 [Actinoplanes sp.]
MEFPFAFDGSRLAPEFARLRQREPVARVVLPTGDPVWLVTRYADVRTVLSDQRFSRAAAEAPGAPKLGPFSPSTESLLGMDPPDHTRLRRMVSRAFTRARLEALRPLMRAEARRLLELLRDRAGPVDLLTDFALPYSTTAILQLLGVPDADSGPLHVWTPVLFNSRGAAGGDPFAELITYLRGIIAGVRRSGSTDGVIGALVTARDDEGLLTEDELIHFILLLVTAGHRSTANNVATLLFHLLDRPKAADRLREQPELIPAAVEEMLRFNPYASVGALPRTAVEDVELGGVTIRAGDTVLVSLGSANHDDEVFTDPDTLDFERDDAKLHVAFGIGIHYCIGAPLARLEMEEAVGLVLRTLPPTLRLAVPAEQVPVSGLLVGYAITGLPVTW